MIADGGTAGLVGAFIPGSTIRWATRRLGLERAEPPAAAALLEVNARRTLGGEILSFFIDEASTVSGVRIAELPFPETAAVMLIVRGDELLAARGPTVIEPGDHVYVFSRREDQPLLRLLFGTPQSE